MHGTDSYHHPWRWPVCQAFSEWFVHHPVPEVPLSQAPVRGMYRLAAANSYLQDYNWTATHLGCIQWNCPSRWHHHCHLFVSGQRSAALVVRQGQHHAFSLMVNLHHPLCFSSETFCPCWPGSWWLSSPPSWPWTCRQTRSACVSPAAFWEGVCHTGVDPVWMHVSAC